MGAYLVNAADCSGCHTKFDMNKLDFDMGSYLAGGNRGSDSAHGFKVNTANLTPDTATDIGGWTEEVFLNKFKNYRDEKTTVTAPGNTIPSCHGRSSPMRRMKILKLFMLTCAP